MNILELKKIRKELGLTQAELAKKVGVSLRGYQNWESGDRKIPTATAILIKNLTNNNAQSAQLIKEGKSIGLGDAIEFILKNIEEAEKIPSFSMYVKTKFQEGEKAAYLEHLNRLLKLKENA